MDRISMTKLREVLEASWDAKTAYLSVSQAGNPALGQCYPTSRVLQLYYPDMEIVEGAVKTTDGLEKHFWNLVIIEDHEYHIDLTWQQFPPGSIVQNYKIRERNTLNDNQPTIERVQLLHDRVAKKLAAADPISV